MSITCLENYCCFINCSAIYKVFTPQIYVIEWNMGKTMLWFAFKNSPIIGLARNYDQICWNHLLFKICSGQNYLFLYVMFILY